MGLGHSVGLGMWTWLLWGGAGGLIGAGVGAVVGLGCGACDFGIVGCVAGLRFPSVLFCFGSRGVCGTIAMPLKRVNWNRLLHEANMAMVLRGIEALKATASSIANTVDRPPKPVQAPTFKRLWCLEIPDQASVSVAQSGSVSPVVLRLAQPRLFLSVSLSFAQSRSFSVYPQSHSGSLMLFIDIGAWQQLMQ